MLATMAPNLFLPRCTPHPCASPERECHTAQGSHDRLARLPRFAAAFRPMRTVATALCGAILLIFATSPSRADDAADVRLADRYQQAAEKGDATAQMYMGAIHAAGVGRPQSDSEAFQWFSRAAEGGSPQAQLILGGLYAIGRGVSKSNVEAYKWALIAAAGKNSPEDKNGAQQLLTQLAKRMSNEDIASAKKQADAWKPSDKAVATAAPRENSRPAPELPNRNSNASAPATRAPERVTSLYGIAQQLAKSGNYGEAIRNFDELIRRDPGDPEALNNRCWALAITGDLDNALKDCDQALRLRPRYGDAFDSRGFVNLKLGRADNAIDDYGAALSLDPKRASSLYGRGIAKTRKGDAEAGKRDIVAAKAIQATIADEFARYGIR
jgi:tetratricopeptide (TPR) repeat protein